MAIIGIIAALLSAASWAFGTVVFDKIGKVIPYVGMTFLKGMVSVILMLILLLFYGSLKSVSLYEFLLLAVSGVIGIAIGDSLFFKSLQDLGAKTQVIFFLLGQILTMLLSLFLLNEVLNLLQYIGAMILLVGISIVIWGKQEDHPNKLRGIFYAILSILCFSISAIITKVAIADVDVVTGTFYRMVFGTVFTLGYGLAFKQFKSWVTPLHRINLCALFLVNCIVITYGGFLLSMVAYKYTSVSLVSILGTTEPIFVIVLAYLINKDKASAQELIGSAISLVGLFCIINYQ